MDGKSKSQICLYVLESIAQSKLPLMLDKCENTCYNLLSLTE